MENYTLLSGRVYKFEVWGAKGSNGGSAKGSGGTGGNGSYAVGWYDMRTSAEATVSIFAGGSNNWSATQYGAQLQGTAGGSARGGSGGGASGIYIGTTALLVAGGGGGGGGGGGNSSSYGGSSGGNGGNGGGQNGYSGGGNGGSGASQSSHGAGGRIYDGEGGYYNYGSSGTNSGGGNGYNTSLSGGGGGAGGGYARGYAGGGASIGWGRESGDNGDYTHGGGGGGGSGGTSYIGGVQSLKNSAKSSTWAYSGATGNGKIVITEYIMAVNVASPTSTDDYIVSAPSKTSALFGESYTFTITREIGVGDVGLVLNSTNGSLALTNTSGNVFTYTVSNVQGAINAANFSTTSYNVAKPDIGTGYTISNQSATSVLKGGSYTFIVNLEYGYAMPMITFSGSGMRSYSGVDINGNLTVTISNVQGAILAGDFTVTMFKV